MGVNDIVMVHDGSYSMLLIKGNMQRTSGMSFKERRFRICDIGGRYPIDNICSSPERAGVNNVLCVDVNDPDFVLFTQERFCSVVNVTTEDISPITHGIKEILLTLLRKELCNATFN